MGRTAVYYGVPVAIAFPLGLLAGFACGLLNGLIITKLRLPPFIVTLGTWSIFGALNTFYSNSETIRSQDMEAAAAKLGANAIVGIDLDYEVLGENNGMLMVTVSGTAVLVQ